MLRNKGQRQAREDTVAARRHLILEAAAACFIDKGFHATSVREIAARAGVSLGNLYNHFDSKQALIAEIASLEASETADMENGLLSPGDPAMILKQFVEGYLAYLSQPDNAVLATEIIVEAVRNPDVGKGFEQNRKTLTKALSQILAKGVESHQFDSGLDTKEVANLIIDLIEGAALRLAFSSRKARKSAAKALMSMIEKSVGGVALNPDQT
jgi:AcrR family transcriptional regulator